MSSATPVVPGLIPRRTVNLVIGSSKSGKTNLILPQLEAYASGEHFFGSRLGGQPEQIGALTCTRTMDDLYYRVSDLRLDNLTRPKVFPIAAWNPPPDVTDMEALQMAYDDLCRHAHSPIKFLFVENIQGLMTSGKVNDQHPVREVFRNLHKFCGIHDLTIIGTMGTAKMKRGESYSLLSDRVFGSSLWSQECSTLIGIEQIDLHLPVERRGNIRRITLQPETGSPSVRFADFNDKNQLVLIDRPDAKEVETESPSHSLLYRRLEELAPGAQMTKATFVEWGEEAGMSMRTVERWLAIACHEDIGLLLKAGNAKATTYTKPVMH